MTKFLFAACAVLSLAMPSSAQRVYPLPTTSKVIRTADVYMRGLKDEDFPRFTKLAPNVYVYQCFQMMPNLEHSFITNVLVVVTKEGVLLGDALETADAVHAMIADIARITPQPIKYVVIGADHIDHTSGDPAFPSSVTFISHPTSKATLEKRAAVNAKITGALTVVIPTEMVSDKKVLTMGGTEIQILHLGRAHTGGDLTVFLPKENIVFMSESFFNHMFPSMATGYPSEWAAALKKAEAMNAAYYVPGHGFIDSAQVEKEELVEFRKSVETIVSEGHRLHDAKVPVEDAPRVSVLGPYNYFTRSAQNYFDCLRRVYMEADGLLK